MSSHGLDMRCAPAASEKGGLTVKVGNTFSPGLRGRTKQVQRGGIGAAEEWLDVSISERWPQEAKTSGPREYRTNAGTPFSSRTLLNASPLSGVGARYGKLPGFQGIKFTFARKCESRRT